MRRLALPAIGLFCCMSTALAAVPAVEREALVALYNSTNGANWTTNTNWLTGDPCTNSWFGVTCGQAGTITEISLRSNQLSGPVPTELGSLASLRDLLLDLNQLSGPIPATLGNLDNLRSLWLGVNQLSGPIPAELGNLANLVVLYLDFNQLSGPIPATLGNLANLRDLRLRINLLGGPIPVELGNLPNLEMLLLDNNELNGPILATLGNLANLRTLWMGHNQLSGPIPTEFGNLANLESLHLDFNQLSGPILTSLGNLSNLADLRLNSNQLSGPIPTELGNPANLQALWLGANQLTGTIPAELGNLSNLVSLYLDFNQLSGPIPATLGNLANLTDLRLGRNQLSGTIPIELGNLANLEILLLDFNQLSGPIPATFGNLANLADLRLRSNQLSGPIPVEFGNLANLEMLLLHYNALYTTDEDLDTFLDDKSASDWSATQTVAPGNFRVSNVGADSVTLAWNPIEYTGNDGGYRVWFGTSSGGPYLDGGITVNKSSTSHTISGLNTNQRQYFIVKTETNSHANNSNIVISNQSYEVMPTEAGTYSVGGMVSGLAGSGLVLQNNAGDNLVIGANGGFTFATALADGSTYAVTVMTQPTNPTQTCTVSNGSGTIAEAHVYNLAVTCGAFQMNAGLNDAWYYALTAGQGFFITVFPELGFVSLAWFTYDTELPAIDAIVYLGDAGHRWITALGPINGDHAIMDIDITSGGIFDTATDIQHTDPPGSDGTIVLTFHGCNSGTIEYNIPSINKQGFIPITRVADDNVALCEARNANIVISEHSNEVMSTEAGTYRVGGTISGLAGSGLVLQNNAGEHLAVSANGGFTFDTALADGSAYAVTVMTQPTRPSQTCTVSNGSGKLAGADVTNGAVTCSTTGTSFQLNAGLNDAWYYSVTAGQGFFITVFPELGFVSLAWFTYDTELPPVDAIAYLGDAGHRWITALGPIVGNQVSMDIDITSGGIFDTATEIQHTDPTGSDGTLTLTFDSCNSGTIEYDIPSINKQGFIPITRVANDNIALCEAFSVPSCSLPLGDENYCADDQCGPCQAGEGDCDSDSECVTASGLDCVHDVGANYGWPADIDVCELRGAKGDVRAHLAWGNDDDLDLHCIDPCSNHIYYSNRFAVCQGKIGELDVDANVSTPITNPAENIVWANGAPSGTYECWVRNYDSRTGSAHYTLRLFHGNDELTYSGDLGHKQESQHYTFP